MSLRDDLIEAGARAIDADSQRGRPEGATPPFDDTSDIWQIKKHREATAAIDAFLDTLADRADEWADHCGNETGFKPHGYVMDGLIAVLRGDT